MCNHCYTLSPPCPRTGSRQGQKTKFGERSEPTSEMNWGIHRQKGGGAILALFAEFLFSRSPGAYSQAIPQALLIFDLLPILLKWLLERLLHKFSSTSNLHVALLCDTSILLLAFHHNCQQTKKQVKDYKILIDLTKKTSFLTAIKACHLRSNHFYSLWLAGGSWNREKLQRGRLKSDDDDVIPLTASCLSDWTPYFPPKPLE